MKKLLVIPLLLILAGCQQSDTESPTSALTETEAPVIKVETISVNEWFDYGCGHCQTAHESFKNLKEKYGERLEVNLRHFPLSASTAVFAEASECARTQGKFDEFHDTVFSDYFGDFDLANVNKIAREIEIPDIEAFNLCFTSGAQKDKVLKDVQAAEKIGVTGTPFFQINNELNIPGAISESSFESLFDELLIEQN